MTSGYVLYITILYHNIFDYVPWYQYHNNIVGMIINTLAKYKNKEIFDNYH